MEETRLAEALSNPSLHDVYGVLAKAELTEIVSCLKEIYEAATERKLRKDLVYLTLLLNSNEALGKLLSYETNQPLGNELDSSDLFKCCYAQKRHWFVVAIANKLTINAFNNHVKNLSYFIYLVNSTNGSKFNSQEVQELLSQIDPENLEQLTRTYVYRINYVVNVMKFCSNYTSFDEIDLFNFINNNSLLQTFSKYLPLTNENYWEDLLLQLKENEENESIYIYNLENNNQFTDTENFIGFTVLQTIIRCVRNNANITSSMNNLLDKICNLQNEKLQLHLLDDVFAVCFMQCGEKFVCTDREIQFILIFLRACMSRIYPGARSSEEYGRYTELRKFVIDALWRLELLVEIGAIKNAKETVNYMLSDSEYLVHVCLKQNRFDKAHQVFQIFNLYETPIAKEVIYTETLLTLRKRISSLSKDQSLVDLIDSFYTKETSEEEIFRDLFDIFLTANVPFELVKDVLKSVGSQAETLLRFFDSIKNLCEEMNQSPMQLIYYTDCDLNISKHKRKLMFHKNLMNLIKLFYLQLDKSFDTNKNRYVAYNTFLKINDSIKANSGVYYMLRLLNYLKLFVKVFYVEGNHIDLLLNHGDNVHFNVFNYSPTDICGKLVFERNVHPDDIEPLFNKIKLDVLYYTSDNCFPSVHFNSKFADCGNKILRKPPHKIFAYILHRNWLLAFIIAEIHRIQELSMSVDRNRTRYFIQFIKTAEVDNLKVLADKNRVLAGLQTKYLDAFVNYMDKVVFSDEDSEDDSDHLETATEVSEDFKCDWRHFLEMCESIPERERNEVFYEYRDRILKQEFDSAVDYKLLRFVQDDALRMRLILDRLRDLPADHCSDLLNAELTCFKPAAGDVRHMLEGQLKEIHLCQEIAQLFHYSNWYEVHELLLQKNIGMIDKLLSVTKPYLLLESVQLYHLEDMVEANITTDYIQNILETSECFDEIRELFKKLSDQTVLQICKDLMSSLRCVDLLQFIVDHVTASPTLNIEGVADIEVSLRMMRCFNHNEQDQAWPLINQPLDIIEMLIMNTKLDKLAELLAAADLPICSLRDDIVSVESVDLLLRRYAEKSLEFRVIVQPHPKLVRSSENKLLESLDSIYGPEKECFVMPDEVPDRSQWVPNNEVVECMCCQITIFSMFNRRHHCRRCGRVICFNCATKRMLVQGYDDIMVRVCIDCYEQSRLDCTSMSDTTSVKSIVYDYWLLTGNQDHNALVRQEFSYEHAPSVSLCLSIMKSHSKCVDYPKFLLEQCDGLLKLLRPAVPNGPQEIDYSLVINMLKSLAIAAKMVSVDCHLQWGASQADRLLAQADLLGLLVERACLHLLPCTVQGSPYVDATVLRRLRDKLLEREQWHFALDVSTKAGLDNAGVFAAWGKSCLKAGCLQMAREKFQKCFEKTGYLDFTDFALSTDLEDTTSTTHRNRYYSKTSVSSDAKPLKNPPLLNKIIEILESQTIKSAAKPSSSRKNSITAKLLHRRQVNDRLLQQKSNEAAACVKNKLRNLKEVSVGNYCEFDENRMGKLETVFVDECVYYLSKYGSHLSLLHFYIKHGNFYEALNYIVQTEVNVDTFVELYMLSLRNGTVNEFQENMSIIDSSLELWKEYLKHLCRHLEKQDLHNCLYQLQLFMGDYVRAAISCIWFYKEMVSSYGELLANIHYLHKARDHLKQELEQQQWVEVNTVQGIDMKSSFEEKALTNPDLVMKMESKKINMHIHTVNLQMEITKFIARNEPDDRYILNVLPNITVSTTEDGAGEDYVLPTLFGSQLSITQLATVCILCDQTVAEGFELALRVIQEHKLKPLKIYCQAGRQLANENRYDGIVQLVTCIQNSGVKDSDVTDMCDEMLALASKTLSRNNASSMHLEALIKLISDKGIKISAYIEARQLKSAYVLAARYNRFGDIRRILREAELLNKPDIKKLCQKLLHSNAHNR